MLFERRRLLQWLGGRFAVSALRVPRVPRSNRPILVHSLRAQIGVYCYAAQVVASSEVLSGESDLIFRHVGGVVAELNSLRHHIREGYQSFTIQ